MGTTADIVQQPEGAFSRSLRVGVLVEQRYLSQAQPQGMMTALRSRGARVVLIDPEDACYQTGEDDWFSELDVVVARGRSWGVLCLLGWLERRGVPSINSRAAIAAVHNKAEMAVTLAAAGIPTPRTLLGSTAHIAFTASAHDYPLILKPVFGDNARGLQVVSNRAQLLALTWPEPFALAQSFIAGSEFDLKLYCLGREVFAVYKPSILFHRNGNQRPEPVPVTPALHELAARCGEVFGLERYGVDCIHTPDGPVVVEVNDFPNYSAIPEADGKLADYVLARLRKGAMA